MIGVFDSGLGGILVLDGLVRNYPNNSFLFHPDRKNAPFGNKNDEELKAIFDDNYAYFLNAGCKDLVVACNTMCSTIDFEAYKELKIHDIIALTVNKVDLPLNSHILLLATSQTIKKGRYMNLLKAKGYTDITALPLKDLAEMIENYADDETIEKYLAKEFQDLHKVDGIILGCTHYPCVSHIIKQFFDVKIFNSNDLKYTFASVDQKGEILLDLEKDEGLMTFLNEHLHVPYRFKP